MLQNIDHLRTLELSNSRHFIELFFGVNDMKGYKRRYDQAKRLHFSNQNSS